MIKMALLLSATVLLVQDLHAATKADSIVTMAGARTKMAWVRWPWCDANYNPVKAYAADPGRSYEQDHPFTQLIGYDTDDGQYRFIDSTIGYHCFPRITRKNGNYVIWNDPANKCSWIRDLARTAPKRKLIDGGDYWVVACQYDAKTDSEYVYVFVRYNVVGAFFGYLEGKGVAKVPLTSAYTVDLTKKDTLIMTPPPPVPLPDDTEEEGVMHTVSVSADGKYMGCNVPIPNCIMVDVASGARIDRHDRAQEYGCQTNIAPDNSYRYYHLGDSHTSLSMFGPGAAAKSSTPMWYVEVMGKMPGSTYGNNNCLDPRWSNNIQILTNSYPLETGLSGLTENIFNRDAAWVKAANPSRAGSFCIAKFSADFKSITSAVRVSDGDVRHREGVGDAWIGSPTQVASPRRSSSEQASRRLAGVSGLRFTAETSSTVTVSDMVGRNLRSAVVKSGDVTDLSTLRNGTYIVTVENARAVSVERVTVQR